MVIVPLMPPPVPVVVFADLDGTLLDRTTFAADAAADAIGALSRARIPLVFCSRKSRAEIELLQQRLDVHHPFIAENGGALHIPDGYFTFDVPYARPSTSGYEHALNAEGFGCSAGSLFDRSGRLNFSAAFLAPW